MNILPLSNNSLVMPIVALRPGNPDHMTRPALHVLTQLFYGMDIHAGRDRHRKGGLKHTLRRLRERKAITENNEVTDEGLRLLVSNIQPKVFGK